MSSQKPALVLTALNSFNSTRNRKARNDVELDMFIFSKTFEREFRGVANTAISLRWSDLI